MAIDITKYIYKTTKIAKNYRIVQLSDFHNNGKINILKQVKALHPDMLFITGDIIDRRSYNLEVTIALVKGLNKLAPIYYVCGNHELWSNENYAKIKDILENLDVVVLDDKNIIVDNLNIIGVKDPAWETKVGAKVLYNERVDNAIKNLVLANKFNILLAHRPEFFKEYAKYGLDIVFSGHVHGGQFIFFRHGLYGPNQGILPKYFGGVYKENNTTMYLSRGLGNSRFPLRINNNFEIIVVDLEKE